MSNFPFFTFFSLFLSHSLTFSPLPTLRSVPSAECFVVEKELFAVILASYSSSSSSLGERRKSSTVQRGESSYYAPPPEVKVDPKPIRENAKKGLKDALKTRIAKGRYT